MFNSISEVQAANRKIGQTWFGPNEMRFFNTVIETGSEMLFGHYFVTSDRMELSDPKRFTVRRANSDGTVSTIGDLQQYDTVQQAVASIRANF